MNTKYYAFEHIEITDNNTWQHQHSSPLMISDWPLSFWNPVCLFVVSMYSTVFFVFVFVSPLLTLGPSWHKAAGVDSGKNQKLFKSWSQRRLTAGDNSSKIWFIKLGRAQNPANWDLGADYNVCHKDNNYFVFSLRVVDYGTMRTSAKLWKLFV